MATRVEEKTIVEDHVTTGDGSSSKKSKPKGAYHALGWDILENVDVKAEEGWDFKTDEFWTFKTCKKYVKMYHIDKLWPKECHEIHTRSFACKPWMCEDDHFIHRAEEVWRALFGDRPRSKGLFNYSLVSMVYAELKLERKVDWTTFPTTSKIPLCIGKTQKTIPDLYDPESTMSKEILASLKKKPQGDSGIGSSSKEDKTRLALHQGENNSVQVLGTKAFVKAPSSNAKGKRIIESEDVDLVIVSKPHHKHDEENVDRAVDNILATHFSMDPHEEKMIAIPQDSMVDNNELEGGILEVQRRLQKQERNVKEMLVGVEKSTNPLVESSNVRANIDLPDLEHLGNGRCDKAIPKVPNFVEVLQTLSDSNKLKELLECNTHSEKYCTEQKTESGVLGMEEVKSYEVQHKQEMEVLECVNNLKQGAQGLSKMFEDFGTLAKRLATLTPTSTEVALDVDKLILLVLPLIEDRVKLANESRALANEKEELEKKCKELERQLEVAKEPSELMVAHRAGTSDKLSLSQDEHRKGKNIVVEGEEEISRPYCGDMVQIECSEVHPTLQSQANDGVSLDGEPMELLKQKLEASMKKRDEACTEVTSLRKLLDAVQFKPRPEETLSWLGWIHQLQDRETMVSAALKSVMEHAVTSDAATNRVHASLERFENILGRRGGGPKEFTVWGDVDHMFERSNHYTKNRSGDIDWAMEVEEGWVPYNTFSAHFEENKKEVIHTCDPGPEFLNSQCCICRLHLGPEGAFALGQCRHMFHITCIAEHSLRRSTCPQCRSPLSSRFYEIMGLQNVMPSGHEYNRWNLPLDQLPKKFLNYRDWGRPLHWNIDFQCHELYEEYGEELDEFMWMTRDYEVELRARAIEDDEARELFCRNFGGHWSKQHKKFFRFPLKRVQKEGDNNWHEVQDDILLGEEYKNYNRTLVGRALVLSKLEEAAKVRFSMSEDSFKEVECSYVDVATAFDKRIGDIINDWRNQLENPSPNLCTSFQENDDMVNEVVRRIMKAIKIFALKEVHDSAKRKRKQMAERDDIWEPDSPDSKRRLALVDQEYTEGGRIAHPSQRRVTRSRAAEEGACSEALSPENKVD